MPWNWSGRGPTSAVANEYPGNNGVRLSSAPTGGGSVGAPGEAAVAHAWPRYDAQYLAGALKAGEHKYAAAREDWERFMPPDLSDGQKEAWAAAAKSVYLERVTENWKGEADEVLKKEFEEWLEGRHELNNKEAEFDNDAGGPAGAGVYAFGLEAHAVGECLSDAPPGCARILPVTSRAL